MRVNEYQQCLANAQEHHCSHSINVFPWRQQVWRRHAKRCLLMFVVPLAIALLLLAGVLAYGMLTRATGMQHHQLLQLEQQSQHLKQQFVLEQRRWQMLQCDKNQLMQIAAWWQHIAKTIPATLQLQKWHADQQSLHLSVHYQRVMTLQRWTQGLQRLPDVTAVHWHEMKQQQNRRVAIVIIQLSAEHCHEIP
jgi:Tfp pilus assembly protein PilN